MKKYSTKQLLHVLLMVGLLTVLFAGGIIWIIINPPNTPPTATASITSTDTPTPGTDTTVTASVTSEAETGTPTTVTETVSHDPETSTPVTNTTHAPTFTGICFNDIINEGFLSDIDQKFYDFPRFDDWCSKDIQYYFSGRDAGSKIKIKVKQSDFNLEDVKSIFIMASVSSKSNPPYNYDPIKGGPVAKITYIYKDGKTGIMDLIPGYNVAHWDYHVESSGFVRTTYDYTYRVWNGLNSRKTNAAQVLITMLDPARTNEEFINLEQNPLIGIEIEAIEHRDLYIDIYGLMISDRDINEFKGEPVEKNKFNSICLGQASILSVTPNGTSRYINSNNLILKNNDYYKNFLMNCKPIISSLILPEELIRPSSDNGAIPRIPLTIGSTIYETRPPSDSLEISEEIEPELELSFNQFDPSRRISKIHLLLSVRNACNPNASIDPRIGMIQLKYSGQEFSTTYLELGKNVRQGRSGIGNCDFGGVDRRFLSNTNSFLYSIPLFAKKTVDTGGQSVALWADVISIPVEGIPANTPFEVVITDLTKPERNESADPDSRDTVEYSDTYLVLYGVTLEYAE